MSIEDLRISAVDGEHVSNDVIADTHEDGSSARQGVDVAQADTSEQPVRTDRLPEAPAAAAPVAAAGHPNEIVPDQNNVAHLPADVSIDDIRIEGNNLVLVQADGTEIVIVNGAHHIPTFLLGEVELPQQAVIAALEQSNINVAAGPDGSYSASAAPSSSGAEFQDSLQQDARDPTQLAQLLADTQQPDGGFSGREELRNGVPTITSTGLLTLTETEGSEGGFQQQTVNGTFGFTPGRDGGNIVAVQLANSLNMEEGTQTGTHVDLTSGGKPVVVTVSGLTITGSSDGHTVFVLTVTNPSTGAFTFTQSGALDHPDKGEAGADDTLRLLFEYTVTDKDGDSVKGTGAIDINDAAPSIAGDAHAVNLLANGDFRSTAATWHPEGWDNLGSAGSANSDIGWKVEGTGGAVQLERVSDTYFGMTTSNGAPMVDLGASPGNTTISQQITGLAAGETYTLKFDFGAPVPESARLEVFWNGVSVGIYEPGKAMVTEIAALTAQAGTNTITFQEIGDDSDPHGTYLANISLTKGVDVPVFTGSAGEDDKTIAFDLAAGKQFTYGADGAGSVSLGTATVSTASGISLTLKASDYSYVDGKLVIKAGVFDVLNAGEIATVTIPFTITDADGDSKTGAYQIEITGANDAATITGDSIRTVTEDGTLHAQGTLTVTDVDAGENHFQAPSSSSLAGAYGTFTFNPANGQWTYDLDNAKAQELREGQTVDETLTVVSADGTAQQTITVTVNGVNDAPEAHADTNTAREAGVGTFGDWRAEGNVLTNDTDKDAGDTKTVTAVVDADNHSGISGRDGFAIEGKYGYLLLGTDGKYVYILNNLDGDTQALKQGEVVDEVFTYTMKDAVGATSSATLTITITGTNDAPIAIADVSRNTVVEDGVAAGHATANGNVLTNDIDVDSDGDLKQVTGIASGVKFGSVSGGVDGVVAGKYGSITLDKDGNWTYTLDNSKTTTQELNGRDIAKEVFTYTMTDAHGVTSTTTLTIEIKGANDAPTITAGPVSNDLVERGTDVAGVSTATVKLAIGDIDDGDRASYDTKGWTPSKLSYVFTMATDHGTATLNTRAGIVTFTLDPAKSDSLSGTDVVTDSVTVTVKDQNGASTSTKVDFTIHGTNDAAVITGKADGSVTEASGVANATAGVPTASGVLHATDVDGSADFDIKSNVATTYGSFSITAAGSWTYTLNDANADVQKLNVGGTLKDSITVTTEDGTPKVIEITIHGANDAAVLSSDTRTLNETNAVLTTDGKLTITDVDSSATFNAGTVNGNYGTLVIDANGNWNYTASSAHNEFAKNEIYTDVFKVTSADGTETSVIINIVGTNDAPVMTSVTTASVAENSTVVMALNATDVDGDKLTYSFSGKDGNLFTVDKDGNLVFKSAPDYEGRHGNSYEVKVTVSDGNGGETSQTIKIGVTNVNEAPVLSPDIRTVTYEENDSGVRLLSNATLSDPDFPSNFDGGSIKVDLSGAVDGDKLIIAADNSVRILGSQVQVYQGGGHNGGWQTIGTISGLGSTSLTITLNDKSDTADVQKVLQTLSFTSSSDDPTSADRTATITFNDGGNDGSGSSLSDTSVITIHVEPCNDDPVISSDGGGTYANVTVSENQTAVTTVTSRDPDGGSPIYSIRASGDTDYTKFVIDPKTGVLSFVKAPDYENPQDGNRDNKYVVDVQVSDGHGGYDIQRLTVTVDDVNEAPVLTPATTAASYIENGSGVYLMPGATLSDPDKPTNFSGGFISVSLNNAQAGDKLIVIDNSSVRIVGTDVQVYQGGNRWQSVGTISGEDTTALKITLNSNSDNADVQKVLQSLGFASSSDNPGNADRTATVTFNDGGHDGSGGALADSSVVTIHVTPVNDAPAGTNGTVTTAEDTAYALKASDFGFTDVDGNALAAVKISTLPGAGTLYLNDVAVKAGAFVPVAEIAAGHLVFVPAANANGNSYASLTFQVQDSGGTTNGGVDLDQSPNMLTINVTPVNDAPETNAATASGNEDKTIAVTLSGSDIDGTVVSYTITGLPQHGTLYSDAGLHNAIAANGVVTGSTVYFVPDANYNGQATFQYAATDNGGLTDTTPATATITIAPVNDAPTNPIDANTAANSVAENAATGTLVGITASATDVDGDTVSYKLTDSAGGRFQIDSATGVVSVADGTKLDYETAQSHSITVEVSDGHGATSTEVFTINVSNVNEAPVITSGSTGSEAENTAVSNVVYQVVASDPEKGALTYSLSGDDAGLFNISSSGAVTFKESPDFEKPLDMGKDNTYNITVIVKDAGNLTAQQAVTITVTDVVEAPVKHDPSGSNATISIVEDVSHTFAVSEFGYSDADGDALASVVIKSIPSSADGVLLYGNAAVAAGQVISAADIASGMLVYVPAKDVYGSAGDASFTFSVRDSSGATDATPNTITLDMGSNYQDDVMKPSDNNFLYSLTGSGSSSHASVTGSNSGSDSVELDTSSGTKFLTLDIERAGDNLEIAWSTSGGERTLTMLDQFDGRYGIEKFGFDGGGTFAGYSLSTNTYTIASGLTGGNASELIAGSGASETLSGGAGNDLLFGGGGNDILKGGEGNDLLVGGAGADKFVWGTEALGSSNADVIAGYNLGEGDKIDLQIPVPTIASNKSISDYVKLVDTGSVLQVQVYVSGKNGGWTTAYTLADVRTNGVDSVRIHAGGQDYIISDNGAATPSAIDPIILDLDHNGIALTTLDQGVSFDINADGHQDKIAWTAGTDGILAYDLDGNGKIDNGSEIFSPHFAGGTYVDGLAALATLDSNHDGKIDAADEAFSKLTVWQGLNHNGITDAGELSSLTDHQITSISLDASASGTEVNGQSIISEGSYTTSDGVGGHFVEVAFDTTLGGTDSDSHAYTMFGSDGDDLIAGGGGMYTITGGAGADTFVLDADAFKDVKLADVITDYKAGEGDALDVSKLLDSLLGHQASEQEALASVKTTVSGTDTVVSVNDNGAWHDVAVLQNTTEAVKILFDDKHDATTAPHVG